MSKLGATLLTMGILAFVLPLMGMQFQLLNLFGDSMGVRLGLIGVGVLLLLLGRSEEEPETAASPGQPPMPAPQTPASPQFVERGPVVPARPRACPTCGNALAPADHFCGKCGNRIAAAPANAVCPNCGRQLPSARKFCTACGHRLG